MWSSVTCTPCCSRSAPISFVTLASASTRRRDAHRTDETSSSIVEHMADVTIDAHTLAFAPMSHLDVFYADAPIFGNAFDQACFSFVIDVSILLFHRASQSSRTVEPGSLLPVAVFAPRSLAPAVRSRPGPMLLLVAQPCPNPDQEPPSDWSYPPCRLLPPGRPRLAPAGARSATTRMN